MMDFDLILEHRAYFKGTLDLEITETDQIIGLITPERDYGIVLYLEEEKLYQG